MSVFMVVEFLDDDDDDDDGGRMASCNIKFSLFVDFIDEAVVDFFFL